MAHTFKVGDIVRGKSQACITGKTMKRGKVVELRNWIIVVELIESEVDYNNKMFKGHTFDVLHDDIELVEPANHISHTIYSPPATIVFWSDGSKTVAKCAPHEQFDREKGLAIACAKKLLGEGYADAFKEFREPVNRVLRFKEIRELPNGSMVYVQAKPGVHCRDGVHKKVGYSLWGENGRTWEIGVCLPLYARVWLLPRKPTADELAANPWKREECE